MEEKELKKLLSSTKVEASKKLKEQIVHQIKAEKELLPAQQMERTKTESNYLSVLGTMYLFLFILTVYFYIKTEGAPLQSTAFIASALFITSSFSIYWFIAVFDDYKKSKSIRN